LLLTLVGFQHPRFSKFFVCLKLRHSPTSVFGEGREI
jgi:hypothetical protein